jgi:hypothetical protein
VNIRLALANQLKGGDLSIKATDIEEAEALKQFADHAIIASESSGDVVLAKESGIWPPGLNSRYT